MVLRAFPAVIRPCVLIGCTCLLLSPVVVAQTPVPLPHGTHPKFAGVYRPASGGFQPASPRRGPAVIFNNMQLSNYYSVPGAYQEWVDEGGLHDRSACQRDQINGFDFVYCSSEPDLTGTSGSITIFFYDDEVLCAGPPAWPDATCSYSISGLPLGTPSGALQCWTVAVDLSGGFECPAALSSSFRTEGAAPHGLFGWGFMPAVPNTGPWLAWGGYRNTCSWTWHDRISMSFQGCYTFGCFPPESFAMRMYGPAANSIAYRSDDPSWPRPLDTLELQSPTGVSRGSPATWQVGNPVPGHRYWLFAATAPAHRAVLGAQASLLIDLASMTLPPLPMPGATVSRDVPLSVPAHVYVQAVETLGALNPSNITAVSNGLYHCF